MIAASSSEALVDESGPTSTEWGILVMASRAWQAPQDFSNLLVRRGNSVVHARGAMTLFGTPAHRTPREADRTK